MHVQHMIEVFSKITIHQKKKNCQESKVRTKNVKGAKNKEGKRKMYPKKPLTIVPKNEKNNRNRTMYK